jgi:hypothetical protein
MFALRPPPLSVHAYDRALHLLLVVLRGHYEDHGHRGWCIRCKSPWMCSDAAAALAVLDALDGGDPT